MAGTCKESTFSCLPVAEDNKEIRKSLISLLLSTKDRKGIS